MVNIFGVNGTFIVAILYVYFNVADTQDDSGYHSHLGDSRNEEGRRLREHKIKQKSGPETKTESSQFRHSKGPEAEKFTGGLLKKIKHSSPKLGTSNKKPILRSFEDDSSSSNSDVDKNTHKYHIINRNKSTDRYHNQKKKLNMSKDIKYKTDNNHTIKSYPTTAKVHSIKAHNKNKASVTDVHHKINKSYLRMKSFLTDTDDDDESSVSTNKKYHMNKNKQTGGWMDNNKDIDKSHTYKKKSRKQNKDKIKNKGHVEKLQRKEKEIHMNNDHYVERFASKNKDYHMVNNKNKDIYENQNTYEEDKGQSRHKDKDNRLSSNKNNINHQGYLERHQTQNDLKEKERKMQNNHNKVPMKNYSYNKKTDHRTDRDQTEKMKESQEKEKDIKKKRKENKSRNKSSKDRNIGEPMRIPKLHSESVKGRILGLELSTQKSEKPHHSKLRTHKHTDDDATVQSTRLTPMYLMQQDGSGEKTKLEESEHKSQALSPYALLSQMTEFLKEFSEANATIETVGRTVEYNDIILIKITEKRSDSGKYFRAEESKYIDEVPEKKIIFIVHGLSVMGSRELLPLNNEHGFKTLLHYYTSFLNYFDIFLIPMANPDGYSAAYSSKFWNKNVSPQEACSGVALDRNFDVAWNGTRKFSSCSQLYPGATAFSEVESRVIRDILHHHGHKILAYIHVHSGTYSGWDFKGDAILYPRGYTELQTDDDKYIDLKGDVDEAMKNASFQVVSVTVDTLCNWYGKVSGTSVDYASSVYGIPYALEFVMQIYQGGNENENESNSYYALTEIWGRLIHTTFNSMWKSLRGTDARRNFITYM